MLNYSTKCFPNSLKCTKIAAAEAPPHTTLGELTAIQIPMMYVVGNEKHGYEISEFSGLVGGADWLCPRPYWEWTSWFCLQLSEIIYFWIIKQC